MTETAEARLHAECARLGLVCRVYEHAPVFTVEDSADVHATVPGQHTKNLFLKDHRGRFWLATLPAAARADLKHLAATMASGRLSFSKPDDLVRLLGVTPGAVTPLAAINDAEGQVTVAIDASLIAGDIAVHPLRNTATMVLAGDALLELLRGWGHAPIVAALVSG